MILPEHASFNRGSADDRQGIRLVDQVSERTVKRYKLEGLPLRDEPQMREIIAAKRSRLGVSKFAPKVAITATAPNDRRARGAIQAR
jgi:hypothetical protein